MKPEGGRLGSITAGLFTSRSCRTFMTTENPESGAHKVTRSCAPGPAGPRYTGPVYGHSGTRSPGTAAVSSYQASPRDDIRCSSGANGFDDVVSSDFMRALLRLAVPVRVS